ALARRNHLVSALALALSGQADAAAHELEAADAPDLPRPVRDAVYDLQAPAWVAAAGGDLPTATRHLADAADVGERIGDLVGAAAALHGLARLGRAADVADRLAAVAARIDGDLAPARAEHARALAAGDAGGLDAVARRFEATGGIGRATRRERAGSVAATA